MKSFRKQLITTLIVLIALFSKANPVDKIFPVPQSIQKMDGTFELSTGRILVDATEKSELTDIVISLKELCNSRDGVSLSITSALAANEQAQISILVDSKVALKSQEYKLNITKKGVQVVANNAAGAFYAVQTLQQIVRFSKGAKLPFVTIEDYPDFERRGMMIDVSRSKVPTMETLKRTIDRFAEWKVNEVQLYIEHTFAYKNHKTVWEEFSPITAEEILELDKYCTERFIDLVPNQNSLGSYETLAGTRRISLSFGKTR